MAHGKSEGRRGGKAGLAHLLVTRLVGGRAEGPGSIPASGADFCFAEQAYEKMFWGWCGGRFGMVSGCFVWDSFWDPCWDRLGPFWDRFGTVLESFRDNFGIVLGSFGDQFGIALGSFWAPSPPIPIATRRALYLSRPKLSLS